MDGGGETHPARIADRLESCSDVNAVAHQVAVGLLDHVAEVYTDAKLDAPFGRYSGVALDEAGLHLDPAAHRVDHAAELDNTAVARALDDAAVMDGDRGVDQVTP